MFLKLVEEYDNLEFLYSFSSDLKSTLQIKPETKFVLLKNFDNKMDQYSGKSNVKALSEFIDYQTIPSLVFLDEVVVDMLFVEMKYNSVILFVKTHDNEIIDDFQAVALENKKHFVFTYVF